MNKSGPLSCVHELHILDGSATEDSHCSRYQETQNLGFEIVGSGADWLGDWLSVAGRELWTVN